MNLTNSPHISHRTNSPAIFSRKTGIMTACPRDFRSNAREIRSSSERRDSAIVSKCSQTAGISARMCLRTCEIGLIGWGGRIRTSAWRNQNPTISLLKSRRIPKNTRKSNSYLSIGYRTIRNATVCHSETQITNLIGMARHGFEVEPASRSMNLSLNLVKSWRSHGRSGFWRT